MACKTSAGLSEDKKKILQAMAGGDGPWANKEIAQIAGLEPKKVSCNMGALKKKGLVESPARCKYVITEAGKSELG